MGGGISTGNETKKVKGSYTGVYKFDRIEVNEPKYPVAFYKNAEKDSFSGEYSMDMEIFTALGRPDKIKVEDIVEAIR